MNALGLENKLSDFAFYEDEDIIDYVIERSINIIGFSAFAKAKNLKNITFPDKLKVIGECAFMQTLIENIEFPSSLKTIGVSAFSGCKNLRQAIIPEGVTHIGEGAFANCENLEEVYLPNSLESLPPQLFLNCKKLKKIHLPEHVESLPDEFFKGCESLDIVLPEKIKELGQGTFNNCYALSTYPEHVEIVKPYTFKGCKSLKSVKINKNITHLPAHLFDTCTNLVDVELEKPSTIDKATFKNCVSLENIPENITNLANFAFENCECLTSINVNSKEIPKGCFRGCINLKEIKDLARVKTLGDYSLSNTGFESIDLSNFTSIPANLLSNSRRLKHVNFKHAKSIGSHAFYRCPNLEYELPKFVEKIGDFAFAYNKKTKELRLPSMLCEFCGSAFAYSAIENIYNLGNPNYRVCDNVLVIKQLNREVLLYAHGSPLDKLDIAKYAEYDNTTDPIDGIGRYAFAGAKKLKEIIIPSSMEEIDVLAFKDNPNLKTLGIQTIEFLPSITTRIIRHGRNYLPLDINDLKPIKEYEWPFEKLVIKGNLAYLNSSMFGIITNLKDVEFDTKNLTIGNGVFHQNKFDYIKIPDNCWDIGIIAFPPDATVDLGDGIKLKNIKRMTQDKQTYKYRVYILEDDSYLVAGNNNHVHISEDKMKLFTTKRSDLIELKPSLFIDYCYMLKKYDLVDQKILRNGILMNASKEALKVLFSYYQESDRFFLYALRFSGLLEQKDKYTDKILQSEDGMIKFINYVELLRKYNIDEPLLFSRIIATECDLSDLEIVLKYYYDLFLKIIKKSNIINFNPTEVVDELRFKITDKTFLIDNNNLIEFLVKILQYNYRDSFLFNPEIIGISKCKLADKFFESYDNNLKRLLLSSGVINSDTVNLESSITNLEDLLTLIYIVGGFESDPIEKQKALTFITEKMTLDHDKGNNNRKVLANDIHRIFNFGDNVRDTFDPEFAEFFIKNYEALYDKEINKSGFIQRTYENFPKISETSSSNKGSQRHLKVTMDKVINFFFVNKFDNVPKKLKGLAGFVGEWYDKQSAWDNALKLYQEMKKVPRNIFVKPILDIKTGEMVNNNDPALDLKEDSYNKKYYYEWLPKHSFENFVLGKYCSCCAHLEGAGFGIMRASIVRDDVQNLVIRNEHGKIVAKATLYINKDELYGVFNTVEASLSIKKEMTEDIKEVYEAFMRGANAFLDTYNKNFERPILALTIGENRNRIIDEFRKNRHPKVQVKDAINYGSYAYDGVFGHYYGDSRTSQLLVLRK